MSASDPPRDPGADSTPIDTTSSIEERRAALGWAEEEVAEVIARLSQAVLEDPNELESLARASMIEVFDVFAQRYIALVSDELELRGFYLPQLDRLSRKTITKMDLLMSRDPNWPEVRRKIGTTLLEAALAGRQQHWKAEAMKKLRESKERERNAAARMQTDAQQNGGNRPATIWPELPLKFENAFEAAKAKAELEYSTRFERHADAPQLADRALHHIILTQNVVLAYSTQARQACREGDWTVAKARQSTEAALQHVCDSYFVREFGDRSEEAKSTHRTAFRRVLDDEPRWKQHLSELAALAERALSDATEESQTESPPRRITEAPVRADSAAARSQIETFAHDAFAVRRDRINKTYAKKLARLPDQVRRTGNSGAYLPARIKLETECLQKLILARADAWLEAFDLFRVPCDAKAEKDLQVCARQMTAGSISAIRGELRLRSGRLRIPEEGRGIPWHLEIERSAHSSVKQGLLKLSRQRITSKASQGPVLGTLSVNRSIGTEEASTTSSLEISKETVDIGPTFWRDLEAQFRALPDPIRLTATLSVGYWRIEDGPSDRLKKERLHHLFRSLARKAALAAGMPSQANDCDGWLNLLREESPHFYSVDEGGWIQNLALASAEHCIVLAGRAYELERLGSPRTSIGKSGQDDRPDGNLPQSGASKKRGRPQTIADEKKAAAVALKASGGTNKQAAALLYDTKYPSGQQTKNVSAILRHHRQKTKRSGSPASPRNTPPKPRKTEG